MPSKFKTLPKADPGKIYYLPGETADLMCKMINWFANLQAIGGLSLHDGAIGPILSENDPIAIGQTYRVNLTKTSGNIGTDTTASSWVYSIVNLAGSTLATGITPDGTRPNGTLGYASIGLAYKTQAGLWAIAWCNEQYGTSHC